MSIKVPPIPLWLMTTKFTLKGVGPSKTDINGVPVYLDPIDLICRKQQKAKKFKNKDSEDVVSKGYLLVDMFANNISDIEGLTNDSIITFVGDTTQYHVIEFAKHRHPDDSIHSIYIWYR